MMNCGAMCFIIHQLEKNCSESDSNDIDSLCDYHYSWGVDFAIILDLEWFLELRI